MFRAASSGMAYGTGSAIAHRAVDSVMGPRTMHVEHHGQQEAAPAAPAFNGGAMDACANQQKAFMDVSMVDCFLSCCALALYSLAALLPGTC